MKFRNIAILILFTIAATALAIFAVGCSPSQDAYNPETWDGAVVTFSLEGGEYKNSKNAVEYYFLLGEGETVRIDTPTGYSDKAVTRPDYRLEEWCRTRTPVMGDNGEVESYEYSDPWNFETDVIRRGDRITLYANWSRLIKFSYNVCFKDDAGETVIIGTYEVDEGARFNDYSKYSTKVLQNTYKKTAIPDEDGNMFFDENDEPFKDSYRHPGGDEDTAVNVYVHCIDGIYSLVYTPDELNAVQNTTHVYLAADIDFEGKTLKSLNNYRGIFKGNNKTVKNFKLNRGSARDGSYGNADIVQDSAIEDGRLICISIFGNAVGAQISDVAFENVTIDVNASYSGIDKVIVAPLFVKMTEFEGNFVNPERRATSATNVSFDGTVTVSKLHEGLNKEQDVIIVTDKMYYVKDDASYIGDDCEFTFVEVEAAVEALSIELYSEQFTRKKEY